MTNFYKAFEDRFRGSKELISERLKVYLPLVQPLKELYTKGMAVDLGCGRGEWLELLNANGFKTVGVDTDEGMLEEARACNLTVAFGDALEYLKSLPNDSISIVSGFHIAEHLPFSTLQELVQESLRVLKPAGLLILETPNPENLAVASNSFYLDPTHIRPLPPLLLSFLPEHYGFARVTIFRLNESVANNSEVPLINIINGASPDYSVIAQKKATPKLMNLFDDEFNKKHGISTEELAMQFKQANNDKLKLDEQMRKLAQREQEVITQLLTIQQQAELQRSELEKRQSANANQEQILGQRLQESQQELRRIAHENAIREQLLTEKSNQNRQELTSLLRTLAQREQEFSAQLQVVREQAEEQRAALEDRHSEQVQVQHREHQEREKNLTLQLQEVQQELRSLGQERERREQLLFGQANKTRHELSAMLRTLAQREQEFAAQLLVIREQAEEQRAALADKADKTQHELSAQLQTLAQREQEFAAQLQVIRKQAEQQRAVLEDKHSKQTQAQRQEWEGWEQRLIDDADEARQEAASVLRTLAQREREFSTQLHVTHQQAERQNKEISYLEGQLQALLADKNRLAQYHQLELEVKTEEINRLMQIAATIEGKIKSRAELEQQNGLLFQQTISDLQLAMGNTALVRRIMMLLVESMSQLVTKAKTTKNNKRAVVVTLATLLHYHDRQFVQNAYQSVLGRVADQEGLDYYTGLLRDGISKKRILAQLRLSGEGKSRLANIPGLDHAVQVYQWANIPLLGKLIQWSCIDDSAGERALRALENKLYRIAESEQAGHIQIESALSDLQQLHQPRSDGATLDDTTVAGPEVAVDPLVPQPAPEMPKNLPHHAGVIYLQLRKFTSAASRNLLLSKAGSDIRTQAHMHASSQLSPHARDVYIQLKEAAFIHTRRSA